MYELILGLGALGGAIVARRIVHSVRNLEARLADRMDRHAEQNQTAHDAITLRMAATNAELAKLREVIGNGQSRSS